MKRVRPEIALTLILLLAAGPVWARMLPVPSAAYPTVQTALDSVQENDTVSVAIGTYAEALHAPAHTFVLRGAVAADTGDYARPILDPAPLPGSDSLCSMIIPAASYPVIEDIHFRNGSGMYPRYQWRMGGIDAACLRATFRRCVFDSLYGGIILEAACRLRLE